jgi:hypothetical protein
MVGPVSRTLAPFIKGLLVIGFTGASNDYRKESKMKKDLNEYQKLDWISFAIQEALNGNSNELEQALEIVEQLRDEIVIVRVDPSPPVTV